MNKVKEILLQWRSPQTTVVLARNLGQKWQIVTVKLLEQLTIENADMQTVILIGSSKTQCSKFLLISILSENIRW